MGEINSLLEPLSREEPRDPLEPEEESLAAILEETLDDLDISLACLRDWAQSLRDTLREEEEKEDAD